MLDETLTTKAHSAGQPTTCSNLKMIWTTCIHDYMLSSEMQTDGPLISKGCPVPLNPVVVRIQEFVERGGKCSNSTKMLQRINILSKYRVQTQKGICGTVLTEQFLPSGEHKNCDHVLTSNLQILSTFQVNNFHVTMYT